MRNSQDVGVLAASCYPPHKGDELWPTTRWAVSCRELLGTLQEKCFLPVVFSLS